MRREGDSDNALELARKLHLDNPDDSFLNKAYGWCLHDRLKKVQAAGDHQAMRALMAEFGELNIPEDDELLYGKRDEWRAKIPAEEGGVTAFSLMQEARAASQNDNRSEALRLYRDAIRRFPDNQDASAGLGWEIYRALKDVLSNENIDVPVVRNLLAEYARLPFHKRPDKLHSLILLQAAKAAEKGKFPTFIQFFQWWDPQYLQPSDFQPFHPADADRAFPSLVAHTIKAINKAAKQENDPGVLAWAADFVGKHYERFPDEEWFAYYYGKLLARSGSRKEARPRIIPIVRRKRNEFWAWDCLADTCGDDEAEMRIACLCRALSCRVQNEAFRVNVHEGLGKLLAAKELYAEARYEFSRAISLRQESRWTISPSLQRVEQQPWYMSAPVLENNIALYEQYADQAEELVLADLPVLDAVLTASLPKTEERPALSFLLVKDAGQLREVKAKTKRFDALKGLSEGTPLYIRIDGEVDPPAVVSVQPRSGEPWDVCPKQSGVVSQINAEHNLTVVTTSKDDVLILHHDRFPESAAYTLGSVVCATVRNDERHNAWRPVALVVSDQVPPAEFAKHFEGKYEKRADQPFAFVRPDSIFCPPGLVEQAGLTSGVQVKGMAVMEFNRRKNSYGWRAVTLTAL